MRLKSYFSETVEGAMALARQELGAEAMLVNSRPAPAEARHLGEYEVVFATELPPDRALPAKAIEGFGERLSLEIAEMKKELEGMRCALRRSAYAHPSRQGLSLRSADAYAALAAAEVAPDLAREIVESAEARLGAPRLLVSQKQLRAEPGLADGAFERALAQEIESRLAVAPLLGASDAPHIVTLVGPPGVGKTTTLVKLAVNYGLVSRRPVLLLSLDTVRVAAAEQLRSYAAILGVGFQIVETVAALAQTIEENRGKELILIDTPGLGPAGMDDSTDLARFLSTRVDIDTQLVLSASTKPADLTRMVDLFDQFHPRRLLFTRLDETGSFGPILNEAIRASRPLSFFSTGQRIPEDLEAASAARVVELLLTGRPGAQRPAA
jgi:flagellar biosynthesis protein FlhF